MNYEQSSERLLHQLMNFPTDSGVIASVYENEKYFIITLEGSGFGIAKPVDRTPKVGQTVTLYLCRGFKIRGVDLNGTPLFFKSEADLKAEQKAGLEEVNSEKAERKVKFIAENEDLDSEFNKRLNRMPKVFQQRFKKFFRLGEDFWDLAWYELVVCEMALEIAYTCKSWQGIRRFYNMTFEEKGALVPSVNAGISGNQFGFACTIANIYLRDSKMVRKVCGAMSPLTGSKPYIGR